jgi:hypothetical protein
MKKSVISATVLLAITMVSTIASLTVGTTIQAQAKTIFNSHSHTLIGDEEGEIKGNDGSVLNTDDPDIGGPYHSNTNDNTNRPVGDDGIRSHTNTHSIPNEGGNSDNDDNSNAGGNSDNDDSSNAGGNSDNGDETEP